MVGWQFCVKTVKNFQVSLKNELFEELTNCQLFKRNLAQLVIIISVTLLNPN
jgi:hypothetical protein